MVIIDLRAILQISFSKRDSNGRVRECNIGLAKRSHSSTGLGYGYAVTGKRADVEKVLVQMNKLSGQQFISPVWMAKIYSGVGDKDDAFDVLKRAYEVRSIVSVAYLKTNPMLDPLRSDPRFTELLRRTNLP